MHVHGRGCGLNGVELWCVCGSMRVDTAVDVGSCECVCVWVLSTFGWVEV